MLFALRFILTALWLLFTSLIFPDFRLGGRYLVLLEASLIVYVSFLIRNLFSYRLLSWKRGLLDGISTFIVLFFMKWFFSEINPAITGLIIAYAGISVCEILFPKQEKAISHNKSGLLEK